MNGTFLRGQGGLFSRVLSGGRVRRGLVFALIILAALIAFEVFNYSTTDYALSDLMGDQRFLGVRWATILALAFCGIDFAGIARLFTPEQGSKEPTEVWYLFGAWLLAATMNAILTWWGVSINIVNHRMASAQVISVSTLTQVVPIFVAVMVWLIRILIIGSLSYAGDRIFASGDRPQPVIARPASVSRLQERQQPGLRPANGFSAAPSNTPAGVTVRPISNPAHKPTSRNTPVVEGGFSRAEPTYHPVSMSPGGINRTASSPDTRR